MIGGLLAVGCSSLLSIRHARALSVQRGEWGRYLGKSARFALCYLGFRSHRSFRQAIQAGKAAFLCCAYDVATDWRGFSKESLAVLKELLESYSRPDLAELALSLYVKDRDRSLELDGLERGPAAFIFVLRMMGSESFFSEKADLNQVGILLQLVDDILDYESDQRSGDLNCLLTSHGSDYLAMAEEVSDDFVALFSRHSFILPHVLQKAKVKARNLSSQKIVLVDAGTLIVADNPSGFVNIPRSPS